MHNMNTVLNAEICLPQDGGIRHVADWWLEERLSRISRIDANAVAEALAELIDRDWPDFKRECGRVVRLPGQEAAVDISIPKGVRRPSRRAQLVDAVRNALRLAVEAATQDLAHEMARREAERAA
jgi:hypothetical protein